MRRPGWLRRIRKGTLRNPYGCKADGTPISPEEARQDFERLKEQGLIKVTPFPEAQLREVEELLSPE